MRMTEIAQIRVGFVAVLVSILILGLFIYWLFDGIYEHWHREKEWHQRRLTEIQDEVRGGSKSTHDRIDREISDIHYGIAAIRRTLTAVWTALRDMFVREKP